MGTLGREVKSECCHRRRGAKRRDHVVGVKDPLAEAGPKSGGEDEMRGSHVRRLARDDSEPVFHCNSFSPLSYTLLDAQDVPTDRVSERVGKGY